MTQYSPVIGQQSLQTADTNLVIVANTGRSGSTLLAQMFESIKGEVQCRLCAHFNSYLLPFANLVYYTSY